MILKATLSGFYQTPLETMLRLGGVRTLVITGFAADNCVLFTAADAYMREYRLDVPRDCVGAKSPAALRRALTTMQELLGARTAPSTGLRLRAQGLPGVMTTLMQSSSFRGTSGTSRARRRAPPGA